MSKLHDYLRLMRISLLPTAWSNVLMGFAVTALPSPSHGQWLALPFLLLCSGCLYLAGMVMNDVCDYDIDCTERPERVLPSGKITFKQAGRLFWILAGAGIVFSILATGINDNDTTSSIATALPLLVMISIYNIRAKRTPLGPVVMGICRAMNVLLGCSVGSQAPIFLGYSSAGLYLALCVGVYVAGITYFAREEHQTSSRRFLFVGVLLMATAIAAIAAFPSTSIWSYNFAINHLLIEAPSSSKQVLFVGLLAMMVFPVFRNAVTAIINPGPIAVRRAVIVSLLTIIMIDASICYLVAPTTPVYALGVASLIIPAFLMSRRIMAT